MVFSSAKQEELREGPRSFARGLRSFEFGARSFLGRNTLILRHNRSILGAPIGHQSWNSARATKNAMILTVLEASRRPTKLLLRPTKLPERQTKRRPD